MENAYKLPYEDAVQNLVKSINESHEMELNNDDLIFVGLITGLQILRKELNKKVILDRKRLNDQEAAKYVKHNEFIKKMIEEKPYAEWILGATTYDAVSYTSDHWRKVGIGGKNHRWTTLAHDPLIGLIIGPVNLVSDTITYHNDTEYGTRNVLPINAMNPATGYKISGPGHISTAFSDTIKLMHTKNDWQFLVAAIIKHLIHMASDIGTKQGLTIPGLSTIPSVGSINMTKVNDWLLQNQFDLVWFADLGIQYSAAKMINAIVSVLYKFLLHRDTDESHEFIEAKTKKVIAIGNAISASEELIQTIIKFNLGDKVGAIHSFDFGGFLVAIQTMLASDEFKKEIKSVNHMWDDITYNFTVSSEKIENEYQKKVHDIDEVYQSILMDINNEYLHYGELQAYATNLNQSGATSFDYSYQFADLNEVNTALRNKDDINNFFNN